MNILTMMRMSKFFWLSGSFLWSGDTAASVPSFMSLRRCATARDDDGEDMGDYVVHCAL